MTIVVYFLPMARSQRVLVVLFDGVQTLDVTGPAEVFAATARQLGRPAYRVELLSSGGGMRRRTAAVSAGPAISGVPHWNGGAGAYSS